MANAIPAKATLERFIAGKPIMDQVTAGRMNAIVDALNARTPHEGVGTLLSADAGGFSYSARPGGRSASTIEKYWDITATSDPAAFTLTRNGAGILPAGTCEISEYYTITNIGSSFTPADAKVLYFKIEPDGSGDITVSLEYDSGWTGIPALYQTTADADGNDTLDFYAYPLYYTYPDSASVTGEQTTVGSFILKKLVVNAPLQVNNVFHRPAAADQVIAAVELVPTFEAFYV